MMQEFLTECGYDTSRLSTPFAHKPHSTMDMALSGSASDLGSINIEVESVESSPLVARKQYGEEITVESLKKMLAEDSSLKKEEESRRRMEIFKTFKNAPFEEIVARSEAKSNHFHNKLNEILDKVSQPSEGSDNHRKSVDENSIPVFEMQFPQLYVY